VSLTGVGHKVHVAGVAGFEADRRAGGNVEPLAAGRIPVETQGAVGLMEVEMGATCTGRSPLFDTLSVVTGRPALSSRLPGSAISSPGIRGGMERVREGGVEANHRIPHFASLRH
jgi:hypothetical protein